MRHPAHVLLATLIGLGLAAIIVFADGGTMLFRKQAGPYVITAFSEPVPVRVGAADISAMVQEASDHGTVLDARVMMRLRKTASGNITEVVAPATHDPATNKLLYAAHITLPSTGSWMLEVDVTGKNGASESVSGDLSVLPAQQPVRSQWPYLAIVPAVILFFVLNQWLRKKRGIRSPRARP